MNVWIREQLGLGLRVEIDVEHAKVSFGVQLNLRPRLLGVRGSEPGRYITGELVWGPFELRVELSTKDEEVQFWDVCHLLPRLLSALPYRISFLFQPNLYSFLPQVLILGRLCLHSEQSLWFSGADFGHSVLFYSRIRTLYRRFCMIVPRPTSHLTLYFDSPWLHPSFLLLPKTLSSQVLGTSAAERNHDWLAEVEALMLVLTFYVEAAPGNADIGPPLMQVSTGMLLKMCQKCVIKGNADMGPSLLQVSVKGLGKETLEQLWQNRFIFQCPTSQDFELQGSSFSGCGRGADAHAVLLRDGGRNCRCRFLLLGGSAKGLARGSKKGLRCCSGFEDLGLAGRPSLSVVLLQLSSSRQSRVLLQLTGSPMNVCLYSCSLIRSARKSSEVIEKATRLRLPSHYRRSFLCPDYFSRLGNTNFPLTAGSFVQSGIWRDSLALFAAAGPAPPAEHLRRFLLLACAASPAVARFAAAVPPFLATTRSEAFLDPRGPASLHAATWPLVLPRVVQSPAEAEERAAAIVREPGRAWSGSGDPGKHQRSAAPRFDFVGFRCQVVQFETFWEVWQTRCHCLTTVFIVSYCALVFIKSLGRPFCVVQMSNTNPLIKHSRSRQIRTSTGSQLAGGRDCNPAGKVRLV